MTTNLRAAIESTSTLRLRLQLTAAGRIQSREEPPSIAARYDIILEGVADGVFRAHLKGIDPPLAGSLEDVVIRSVYLHVYDSPGFLKA